MKKTHILTGSDNRKFLADVYYPSGQARGIVIFSHGFKGFKDWGAFPKMAEYLTQRDFICILFNFSHNGTTLDKPTEFADLEAFGNNNFSKELYDLSTVIDFAQVHASVGSNQLPLYLLGHSRGGGISLLAASEYHAISKVAVWGCVSEFGKFWKNNEMEKLMKEGVIYIYNTRTCQQMPVYKQLYENYEKNIGRLHIPTKVKNLACPLLIVHGTCDETVPVQAAIELKNWKPDAELFLIEDADHTFGSKHPFTGSELPQHFQMALDRTIQFFSAQSKW